MESKQNMDEEGAKTGNIHTEFEKKEFYKWFENRGLLSELRAYMRQLMVKALEDSNKNVKMSSNRKSAASPKLQAINLLLVDYLFHEDYLYTVSVFASEAQILESLPQYSRYVTETVQQHRWDPSCVPRFSHQETEDILDTLRLLPSHKDMQQATRLYQESQESLLTCVARTLASSRTFSPVSSFKETEIPMSVNDSQNGHQLWSKEMQNLLLMAGIKLQHIQRMQQKWQLIIKGEKQKAREECENDQQSQQVEWELRLREEVEEELRTERSKLEQRESDLNSLADQLSEVHEDISRRLAKLQEQSENLQERERQQQRERELLDKRCCEIQKREENLELAIASLSKEFVEVTDYQMAASAQPRIKVATSDSSVQVSEPVAMPGPQVKLVPVPGPQVASAHTQTVNTVDNQQQTSSVSEPDSHLLLQLQTEREKINELQEENLELRAHALQQRHRIDELTNRAASLSTQLQESQLASTLLNGGEQDNGGEHDLPPVLPPWRRVPALPPPSQGVFTAPIFGFNSPQRLGAGEESLFTPRPQQAVSQPDGRRRPSRFSFSNNPNPTSEESSPTDEVVQNARARIEQLEAESVAVQRNYQDFQTRLLTSDSVMFPPLDATPRTADHLFRVRRHNLLRFVPQSTHNPSFHFNNYLERASNNQTTEEEDSSSDQALFNRADRIESMSNARRLFTQRNIRHYERWKLFKKKFQKQNDIDLDNRRNNTSSEDEENFTVPRRRYVINKAKGVKKSQTLSLDEQNYCNRFNVIRNKTESADTQELIRKENDSLPNLPELAGTEKDSNTTIKSDTALENKSKEDKLRLEIEQSNKLIDSVKILLEEQALMDPVEFRTFSDESLAVESLPKDSDDNTQHEIGITENISILTVRKFDPIIQNEIEEKNIGKDSEKESTLKASICKDLENILQSQEDQNRGVVYTTLPNQKGSKIDLIEDGKYHAGNSPLSLNIPPFMSSNTSIASKEQFETIVIPATDVAEQGIEDRGTTSVTSASDILRELNPSRDSSGSVVSTGTGCVNESHSSDFWN